MRFIKRHLKKKAYPFVLQAVPMIRNDHKAGLRGHVLRAAYALGRLTVRAATRLLPRWGNVLLLNGLIEAAGGRYQLAEPYFHAAMRARGSMDGVYFYLGMLEMSLGYYANAERMFVETLKLKPYWAQALVNLGQVRLALGDENAAVPCLTRAVQLDSKLGMAHQNLAARYDRANYQPSRLDRSAKREVALYDAYNLAGERLIHLGRTEEGVRCYTSALIQQRKIESGFDLPRSVVKALQKKSQFDPNLPVRILGYEWVTQIGHLGMIDTYLKMQRLGWRPKANVVVFAPRTKVVNPAFLKLYRNHVVIVSDDNLVNALFPYQRHIGDTFNGFINSNGTGEDWCEAGARAHIAWDEEGRGPLIGASPHIVANGFRWLEAHGYPKEGSWFVALHARSGGFYREGFGSSQGHRNASVASYIPAIKAITRRGGWVVRMGDSAMVPLPPLPCVIDYAHSRMRQDWLDVFFWSQARFFLGTTSGPTNAVMALNTPALLVNCLSNYAQLWNNRTLFTLKPFWSRAERRYIPVSRFTREPMRGMIFNIEVLARQGIFPLNNSSDDILAATKEMLQHLDAGTLPKQQDAAVLAGSDCNPAIWGNAHPSRSFFERNRSKFF